MTNAPCARRQGLTQGAPKALVHRASGRTTQLLPAHQPSCRCLAGRDLKTNRRQIAIRVEMLSLVRGAPPVRTGADGNQRPLKGTADERVPRAISRTLSLHHRAAAGTRRLATVATTPKPMQAKASDDWTSGTELLVNRMVKEPLA